MHFAAVICASCPKGVVIEGALCHAICLKFVDILLRIPTSWYLKYFLKTHKPDVDAMIHDRAIAVQEMRLLCN